MTCLQVGSLFSGIGGFDVASERVGMAVRWQVEIDDACRSVLARHWPDVPRYRDIRHVHEQRRAGCPNCLPAVDVLAGGFPCFGAGTLVLTDGGYRPIESLVAGDLVLTHRGRWRPISGVMHRWADSTVLVRGHGFPAIRTTDEHPFWARRHGRRWRSDPRGWDRVTDKPRWIAAGQLAGHHACQVLPGESADAGELLPCERSADFWWIVGRYLADGWRQFHNGAGRVVICANPGEAGDVEERIRRVYPCTRARDRTTVKFHITRTEFWRWLEPFGNGAAGKRVPGWVLSLDSRRAEAMLDGYLTGDGHCDERAGVWKATSVSRALALGIGLLAQRARGVVAAINEADVPEWTEIEGRRVRQQRQYQMVIPLRNRSAVVEGDYGWKLVRRVEPAAGCEVYNVSVADDESYVADGCVVHNCQDVSVAGGRAGLAGARSGLWFEFHRLAAQIRPRWLVIENVPGLLSSNGGRDFGVIVRGLVELGYGLAWRVLDAQYFGVAQRRRRVFVVGCLGDPAGAAAVLFEPESCGGHPAPRRQAPEDAAGSLGSQPAGGGWRSDTDRMMFVKATKPHHAEDGERWEQADASATLDSGNATRTAHIVAHALPSCGGGQRYEPTSETFVPSVTPCLPAYGGPRGTTNNPQFNDHALVARALRAKHNMAHRADVDTLVGVKEYPTAGTIRSGAPGSQLGGTLTRHAMSVRRLTPTECERLQGFPDGWTEPLSDSARYRCLGNAVCVPVVEWIGRRLVAVDGQRALALEVG